MKVALVFEMIPEETRFYIIDDASSDDMKILNGSNGKYFGRDDCADLLILLDMVAKAPKYCEEPDSDYACAWKDKKVELSELSKPGVHFDAVFVCGFIM